MALRNCGVLDFAQASVRPFSIQHALDISRHCPILHLAARTFAQMLSWAGVCNSLNAIVPRREQRGNQSRVRGFDGIQLDKHIDRDFYNIETQNIKDRADMGLK